MRDFWSILLILLCYFSIQPVYGQSLNSGYEVQNWSAPGVLGVALVHSQASFPKLEVQGWEDGWQLDRDASHCQMTVKRPLAELPPLKDSENSLKCSLFDKRGGKEAVVTLPLPEVAVSAWGNRAEESHWRRNGLPKTFQFVNQDINLALYAALHKEKEAGEALIYRSHFAGPAGVMHAHTYSLDVMPDEPYSPAYVICTINSDRNQQTNELAIFRTQCTFSFPTES